MLFFHLKRGSRVCSTVVVGRAIEFFLAGFKVGERWASFRLCGVAHKVAQISDFMGK
jgi:hypothetical protein